MKRILRTIGVTVAAAGLTVAVAAAPAHAKQDTTWGCPGCVVAHK